MSTKAEKQEPVAGGPSPHEKGDLRNGDAEGPRVTSAPPAHPLHSRWCLWVSDPNAKRDRDHWNESMFVAHKFSTVEDFWRMYRHIHTPLRLGHADHLVFREGITPAWESGEFKAGGRWLLRFEQKHSIQDEVWLTTLLAMIGEFFPRPSEVKLQQAEDSKGKKEENEKACGGQEGIERKDGERVTSAREAAVAVVRDVTRRMSAALLGESQEENHDALPSASSGAAGADAAAPSSSTRRLSAEEQKEEARVVAVAAVADITRRASASILGEEAVALAASSPFPNGGGEAPVPVEDGKETGEEEKKEVKETPQEETKEESPPPP
eukprot:Cvel_33671.t1-p1 / transcript=Cvel_33671.t1 / gene=Cvel_33671 / organism=Chromera_velia_CCMP2878 / gene_product=Eukaryotic translation initiation factor 4E-1, putative / transcript_product=Eukaryotic translation initiation factor 4E-1, putative / location=Cvel_scaffold5538:1-2157(-) / protein_length=323 / sequence_SO=supercontig / SO=protein_coding / is_pseudo=false